jgi:hypothetical protein
MEKQQENPQEEDALETFQNGGSFFDPGDAREAAEVWCGIRSGKWPSQLPLQRIVQPNGKAGYVFNGMMLLGAKSVFEFLGLDKLGNELWERRIAQGRDPATGAPQQEKG